MKYENLLMGIVIGGLTCVVLLAVGHIRDRTHASARPQPSASCLPAPIPPPVVVQHPTTPEMNQYDIAFAASSKERDAAWLACQQRHQVPLWAEPYLFCLRREAVVQTTRVDYPRFPW